MKKMVFLFSVPHNTVIQELRNFAMLYAEQTEELSMAMMVYMLVFNTYMGFGDGMDRQFGEKNYDMLKRIYEYAKRL